MILETICNRLLIWRTEMKRIPERELMTDNAQARAYAEADFEEPHNHFIELFKERFKEVEIKGTVLDLGCGPGDISFRFAREYPNCVVHGVDGSKAMIHYGHEILSKKYKIHDRVQLIHGLLPKAVLPKKQYDVIISNSILHHLPDPQILWKTVKAYADKHIPIFIMDLFRPENEQIVRGLVEKYAQEESWILKLDYFNSFIAAYEPSEIRDQLKVAELDFLTVEQASDRHVIISGMCC